MRRKRGFLCIALILGIGIILFGVVRYFQLDIQIHNYSFKGENEQWAATYEVHSKGFYFTVNNKLKYNGKSEKTFKLTYIGDLAKLSAAKKVEYKVSTGEGGTREFASTPGRNIAVGSSKSNSNLIIPDDDIELIATIKGSSPETIVLHKAK